jgi:hypothetical protein
MAYAFGQREHLKSVGDVNDDGIPDVYHDQAQFLYDARRRTFNRRQINRRDVMHPLHAAPPEALLSVIDEQKKSDFTPRYLHYYEGIDLNADGRADLGCGYFASYGGARWGRYLLAEDTGHLTDATERLGLPKDGAPILFHDFNDDGADDVLVAGAGMYLSRPEGGFALKPGPVTDFLNYRYLYSPVAIRVDFANTGRPDLVIHNGRNEVAKIFENRTGGEFHELVSQRTWTDAVVACDINNDGLIDVAIAGPEDSITVYLNETKNPGTGCFIHPRIARPNPYAVGATIDVYRAGALKNPGAKPLFSEQAHPEGTPIHFGLGDETTLDLRVTFPGKTPKVVEFQNVTARPHLGVTAEGLSEE